VGYERIRAILKHRGGVGNGKIIHRNGGGGSQLLSRESGSTSAGEKILRAKSDYEREGE
jgi:hypothetical protein